MRKGVHKDTMKLLFTFLFVLLSVHAKAMDRLHTLYASLDSVIDLQPSLIIKKEEHIANVKKLLVNRRLSDREKYQINEILYNEYSAFKYDSAMAYADRCIAIAEHIGSKELLNKSLVNKIHLLSVTGLFEAATKLTERIDTLQMSQEDLMDYYSALDDLFLYKAEYTEGTDYSASYIANAIDIRKRILSISPRTSFTHIFTKATICCFNKDMKQAISLMESLIKTLQPGERQYSIATSTLAFFYDTNGNKELMKEQLILSAISDIKGCIRETTSIRQLAALLYAEGDINKAYRYLSFSMGDADFYNTKLRSMQTAKLMPLIVGSYQKQQAEQEHRLSIMLLVSYAVVAALMIGLVFIVVLAKRYKHANKKIHVINAQLNKAMEDMKSLNTLLNVSNDKLRMSNKIKEEYIGKFLDLCSSYIDKVDDFQKELNKLAMYNKMSELFSKLKTRKLNVEMTNEFYQNFDSTFLNIFPDFVTNVNNLLYENEKIVPKQGERLTTELRVFALIRLGITDNQKIASILRSSITTIYTYRSKVKNKSMYKKDFEERVMEIGK